MSLEFFVAAMCIGQFECDNTLKAYWEGNKALQAQVKIIENNGKRLIGDNEAILFIAPIMVGFARQDMQIPAGQHLSFRLKREQQTVNFSYSF
jgi:hypothetical protein